MWRLNDILTAGQERDGFAAFEDEDFIYIKRFDQVCLVFGSSGATKESIREAVESIRSQRGLIAADSEGKGDQR